MGRKLSVMKIAVISYTLVTNKHKEWDEMRNATGATPCLRQSGYTIQVT